MNILRTLLMVFMSATSISALAENLPGDHVPSGYSQAQAARMQSIQQRYDRYSNQIKGINGQAIAAMERQVGGRLSLSAAVQVASIPTAEKTSIGEKFQQQMKADNVRASIERHIDALQKDARRTARQLNRITKQLETGQGRPANFNTLFERGKQLERRLGNIQVTIIRWDFNYKTISGEKSYKGAEYQSLASRATHNFRHLLNNLQYKGGDAQKRKRKMARNYKIKQVLKPVFGH